MAAEMADGSLDLEGLFVLRRSVHRFLSTRAASWWQGFSMGEQDVVVPPELAAWPPRKRFTALAKLERRRIVRSRLFQLDEMAAEAAVQVGAKIRTAGHANAVARTGRAEVVESFGTAPPAACGFLRWAGPVGYDPTWGSPIRVCHWGPQGGGVWMTWWAEVETAAEALPRVPQMLSDLETRIWGVTCGKACLCAGAACVWGWVSCLVSGWWWGWPAR
jgi:hypothetical protein